MPVIDFLDANGVRHCAVVKKDTDAATPRVLSVVQAFPPVIAYEEE